MANTYDTTWKNISKENNGSSNTNEKSSLEEDLKSTKEKAEIDLENLLKEKKEEIKEEFKTKHKEAQAQQNNKSNSNNTVNEIKYGSENDKEALDKKFTDRYVKDEKNNYRWAFNNDIIAFQDKGKVIVVKGKPASVSEDVAKLLKSQGVTEIKVDGEKEHKQRIWMAATERGIEVKGYKPSKQDLKEMESMTNKITILKQEKEPKKEKKEEVLRSHRNAATKVAEKSLHSNNKAAFIREILSKVNEKLNRGEKVQKVNVKENEKEAEK